MALTLAVGESKTFEIQAAERWNHTLLEIEAGEIYQITSSGTWTDWETVSDADGYDDPFLDVFSNLKRNTDAKWFELVGAIDTVSQYVIGSNQNITFNESGNLSLFANDAEGFYGNNTGSISTTITRIE